MSNGEVCCITGVCCAPDVAQAKLAAKFVKLGAEREYAEACARYVQDTFDLAPKGMLTPIYDYVKEHAK